MHWTASPKRGEILKQHFDLKKGAVVALLLELPKKGESAKGGGLRFKEDDEVEIMELTSGTGGKFVPTGTWAKGKVTHCYPEGKTIQDTVWYYRCTKEANSFFTHVFEDTDNYIRAIGSTRARGGTGTLKMVVRKDPLGRSAVEASDMVVGFPIGRRYTPYVVWLPGQKTKAALPQVSLMLLRSSRPPPTLAISPECNAMCVSTYL